MVTRLSGVQSVIIQAVTKSDNHAAGVQFLYYEYYDRSNLIIKKKQFQTKELPSYIEKGKFALKY